MHAQATQPRPALNFFGRHPFQRGTLPQNLLVHRGASKLQTPVLWRGIKQTQLSRSTGFLNWLCHILQLLTQTSKANLKDYSGIHRQATIGTLSQRNSNASNFRRQGFRADLCSFRPITVTSASNLTKLDPSQAVLYLFVVILSNYGGPNLKLDHASIHKLTEYRAIHSACYLYSRRILDGNWPSRSDINNYTFRVIGLCISCAEQGCAL